MLSIQDTADCPAGLFAHDVEGQAYLQAFDRCQLSDPKLGYLQVWQDGQRLCAMPYFVMTYRLSTMVSHRLLKYLLKPFVFRIAAIGHPFIDVGRFEGQVNAEVLKAIHAHLSCTAHLLVYKMFTQALPLHGFTSVAGLPIHHLDVPQYFASMRANRRKNIRKRLAKSQALRYEWIANGATLPQSVLEKLHELYLQTTRRAEYDFVTLPASYFVETAAISQYQLAYEGERLIGFIQLISRGRHTVAPYIGMDYDCSERYGLYFSLIIESIAACHRQDCQKLELGPTNAYFKKLIGCQVTPTTIYYRHGNPIVNWLLARCSFLLKPSRKELG